MKSYCPNERDVFLARDRIRVEWSEEDRAARQRLAIDRQGELAELLFQPLPRAATSLDLPVAVNSSLRY